MKTTPSDTWTSPTMLSSEEIQSLREETARDLAWLDSVLAQRRAVNQNTNLANANHASTHKKAQH